MWWKPLMMKPVYAFHMTETSHDEACLCVLGDKAPHDEACLHVSCDWSTSWGLSVCFMWLKHLMMRPICVSCDWSTSWWGQSVCFRWLKHLMMRPVCVSCHWSTSWWGQSVFPVTEHLMMRPVCVSCHWSTSSWGLSCVFQVTAFPEQNKFGLKNIVGNVWEWTQDWWEIKHTTDFKDNPVSHGHRTYPPSPPPPTMHTGCGCLTRTGAKM